MIILNFGHPLTSEQRSQIEALAGKPIDRVIDIPSQIDSQQPLAQQVVATVEGIGLEPADWQQAELVINPPALNFSAVVLLAELHGRMGYFPPSLRLRPVPDALPPRFEVCEVLNLNVVREEARTRR